jgi:GTPase SAR1 family protein
LFRVSLQPASQEEGRNGLIHRYLLNNLDWIDDELGDYDSDYLIIDCPGQIELYTHIPLLPRLLTHLQVSLNFRTSAAYLIDSQFMQDKTKFFAGVMSAMSCMLSLGVSMVCVMSKMDLVKDSKGNIKREVGRYVSLSPLDYLESSADW